MQNHRIHSTAHLFLTGILATSIGCVLPMEPEEELWSEGDEYGTVGAEVVYGVDNRMDVYEHPNATLRERARQSTVALMHFSVLDTFDPSNVFFLAPSLQVAQNLCTTERFLNDVTPAHCSGTLIDDDLVLTAGHCIDTGDPDLACSNTRFVFDFYRPSANTSPIVTTSDIFHCSSVVARQLGVVNGQNLDFAVVRLDRPATLNGFVPAPIRPGNPALSLAQNVAVIGTPSGIPFKIDSGGSVRDPRAGVLDFFVGTTDTFGGNSGSGVYETAKHTLAGILVRGEVDYRANGACNVAKTCAETGCTGESITYVRRAIDAYCAVASSWRLCGNSSYSATNTNSAQQNTTNLSFNVNIGDRVTVATCGLPGSSFTGDTFLRLFSGATQVALNDDACGGVGSSVTHTATVAGTLQVRAGCFSSTNCSGTLVLQVTPATVFSDDFETSQGWVRNPDGTDTATSGTWDIGAPEATTIDGNTFQLGVAASGSNALVTGRLAGGSWQANDVDKGKTTMQSPAIALPAGKLLTLEFTSYLAHDPNATSADALKIKVKEVGVAGSTVVYQELGRSGYRFGAWTSHSVDISAFAGKTIVLQVEATDPDPFHVIEAAVDLIAIRAH